MLHSIRYKLIAITTLFIVVCTTTVFLFSIQQHEYLYRQSVEKHLTAMAENMADDLVLILEDLTPQRRATIAAELKRFERYEFVRDARVFDAAWQPLYRYIPPTPPVATDAQFEQTLLRTLPDQPAPGVLKTRQGLLAVKRIGEPANALGYLAVGHDVGAPLQQSRWQLVVRSSPMILTAIGIAVLASMWVYHRLLSPLEKLSRFTRKVEQTGNYQLKMDLAGRDEVSQLAQDINKLMQAVHNEAQINKKQTEVLLAQQKSMQRLANFDVLTGLPNRMFFMDMLRIELARSKRQKRELAIMFVDVDGFKEVNDTLGHDAGDQLLIAVAREIGQCLRESDILSRLGGDEFLIMMPDLHDPLTAYSIANRIIRALQQPLNINGWSVIAGVSIGIARATDAEFDINTFISNADVAMYASKERGKGTVTEFHQGLLAESRRRLKIAGLIHQALGNQEFTIHYQPKVAANGRVDGFEALIRWFNSELGDIPPGEFIPIAEQGGKMQAITRWVIDRVFQDVDALRVLAGDQVLVSLNVSSHDLKNLDLIGLIQQKLGQYQVSIDNIQLEITESSYLDNFDSANEFFAGIRMMGGSIALDDFGIGYSSLSYLTKINIDTLKIDRAFVCGYDTSRRDTIILKTILELADKMGLVVCSEGVETAAQAEFILSQGQHTMQGFFFADPVPIEKLAGAVEMAQTRFRGIRNLRAVNA